MKRSLKFLWHWSWLLTLPITILFIYWAGVTIERYYTFHVRYNSVPSKMSLIDAGKLEASHILRMFKLSFLPKNGRNSGKAALRTLNVFIPESSLAQLDSNLPHSGFEYVEGA